MDALLAQQITDLVGYWREREAQFKAWLGGTATGGPNNDGRYPLSDAEGVESLVDCPAKLAATVGGPAALSEAAKVAALAAATQATNAASQAAADKNTTNSNVLAITDLKNLVLAYRDRVLQAESYVEADRAAVESDRIATQAASASAIQAAADADADRTAADSARVDAQDARTQAQTALAACQSIQAAINPSAYAPASHTHTIANVTGLQTALDNKLNTSLFTWTDLPGKPSTFTPTDHSHVINDVTGLQTALDAKLNTTTFTWGNLPGRPTTFTPAVHSHVINDVTGLQTALDGKSNNGHTHVINDVTGLQTVLNAKANLADPTFSGNVNFNGSNGNIVIITADGSIEIVRPTGGAHIDFKDSSAEDFDVRIQASGSGLNIVAPALSVGGNAVWHAGTFSPSTKLDTSAFTWSNLPGRPTTFTPSAHSHIISEVTGLQSALDSLVNNIVHLTSFRARTNSGFYQATGVITAAPTSANQWWHMMSNTHSNSTNFFALQLANGYGDNENVYWRSVATGDLDGAGGSIPWRRFWSGQINTWLASTEGVERLYFESGGASLYKSANYHEFRLSNDSWHSRFTPEGLHIRSWSFEGNANIRYYDTAGGVMTWEEGVIFDGTNDWGLWSTHLGQILRINRTTGRWDLQAFTGQIFNFQTRDGLLRMGAENTAYCHFYTDRNQFYFNKRIEIDGQSSRYLAGAIPNHEDVNNQSAVIRVRTSAPAAGDGANGDIWLVY